MKEHNSIGKINISKINSNGEELFNSHIKEVNNFIAIKFYKGKFSKSSTNKLNIYQDKIITSIYLTNEQFAYFLLNKNRGVPCTISYREDEKFETKNYQHPKDNKNYYQQIIEDFKKEIIKIFPLNYKIKKLSKELLAKQDSESLKKLNKECFEEWKNNQSQVKELLNKTIKKIMDYNQETLIEKNKEGFSDILGISNNTKLLENNKKLPINKKHGYIVLKEIKSKEGFIEDLNVINGYRITVYQAIEEIVNNKYTIKPSNEVLVSIELSVSQFSNFITSFNQGEGITSTLVETKKLGKIKKDFDSLYLDNFERKLDSFINTIEKYNKDLEELETKIESSLKRKYKSKTKQRELEINFEQYFNKTISNIIFYTKDLLEESIKQNLSKHQDFISNIDRKLQDIAKKEIQKQIKENQTLLLN